jgi:hypothetical protein
MPAPGTEIADQSAMTSSAAPSPVPSVGSAGLSTPQGSDHQPESACTPITKALEAAVQSAQLDGKQKAINIKLKC